MKVVQVLVRDASEPRDGVVLHGEEEDQRSLSVCNSTESVGDVDLSHRPWAIVQGDDDSNQEIDGGPKSVGQSLGGIKPLGKAPGDERVSSADLDRVPFARLVRTTRFLVG